jgi:uncharacterized protein (DUF433 family)
MNQSNSFHRIGNGVYGFPEAAKLAGIHPATIRAWFVQSKKRKALFSSDYEAFNGAHSISFFDLIEAKVASSLRHVGVSMFEVRKIYNALGALLDENHPFTRQELLHDGKRVWLRALTESGNEHYWDVIQKQQGIPEVVRPFLKSLIYDGGTGRAIEWSISEGVAVNPSFCLGKPATVQSRRPTRLLALAYSANNKDADSVADWYAVSRSEVLQAVAFEEKTAA